MEREKHLANLISDWEFKYKVDLEDWPDQMIKEFRRMHFNEFGIGAEHKAEPHKHNVDDDGRGYAVEVDKLLPPVETANPANLELSALIQSGESYKQIMSKSTVSSIEYKIFTTHYARSVWRFYPNCQKKCIEATSRKGLFQQMHSKYVKLASIGDKDADIFRISSAGNITQVILRNSGNYTRYRRCIGRFERVMYIRRFTLIDESAGKYNFG